MLTNYNLNISTWTTPLTVTLNLLDGENIIEVVTNNSGGGAANCTLIGDIIDNTNVFFVKP